MRADVALVLGGTGAVGRAVVAELARREVPTTFTFHRSEQLAKELAKEHSSRAVRADLREPDAIERLAADAPAPTVVIHCAAASRFATLGEITAEDWQTAMSVGGHAAFAAAQRFAASARSIVFVGALDGAQSLPTPVHFAATQGLLSAMTMALGKELGPAGTRVNMVALGPLDAGLSRHMPPAVLADFEAFSALRRRGSPTEAAAAIVWLALDNTYMNGRVLPVNGGL